MLLYLSVLVVVAIVRSSGRQQRRGRLWRVCHQRNRQQTGVKSAQFRPRVLRAVSDIHSATSTPRWRHEST